MSRFRDAHAQFAQLGAAVVGISIDSGFANAAFAKQNGLNYPLAGDPNRGFTREIGVLAEKIGGVQGACGRYVLVIDPDMNLRWAWGTGETRPLPEPADALAAVREVVGA